jgi:hypothetical protein
MPEVSARRVQATRLGFGFAAVLVVASVLYAVWPIHTHVHGVSSYCGWPPAAAFADQNEYGLGPDCRDQGMKHLFVGGLLFAWGIAAALGLSVLTRRDR